MNARRIRVRASIVENTENEFVLKGKKVRLIIPKSYVLKTNNQDYFDIDPVINKRTWINFYLDPDFFKHDKVYAKIKMLRKSRNIVFYGHKKFGIIWSNVVDRMYSRPLFFCFYCDEKLTGFGTMNENKSRDHLIPRIFLKAYGIRYIEDNSLPCCMGCNAQKANLHPYIFREKVKLLIEKTKDEKWNRVLKVLNKILIEKKDIFG